MLLSKYKAFYFPGVPRELAVALINENEMRMIVAEKGDGWFHWVQKSKLQPMDICFKLNEEFTFMDPVLKENVTVSTNI